MKKLLCVLLMLCCLNSACSAEIYTPRALAGIEAERLLEDTYGIEPVMLTYFNRVTEKTDNGYVITYSGAEAFYDVLGTYTVTLGSRPEIVWSHDGEDTSGMLDASAWGKEQLAAMVSETARTRSISPFWSRAMEIAESHGVEARDVKSPDIDMEDGEYRDGEIPEDVLALMKQAAGEQYGLSKEQMDAMTVTMASENDSMILGYLWLAQHESDWTEKDGQYTVAVLLDSMMVDYLEYDAALAGNG